MTQRTRTWGALAAVGLLLIAAGCRSPSKGRGPQPAEPDAKLAAAAAQRGNWREAANRWYAVHLADRTNAPGPIVEAARAFLNLKDPDSANSLIEIGLRHHPANTDLLELKGRALTGLGFRRAAESYYQRVLRAEPLRTSALLAVARLRVELRQESAALQPLEQFNQLTGGDYESWSLLARALRATGDAAGAYQAWKRAFASAEGRVEDYLVAASAVLDPGLRNADPEAVATCRGWLEAALSRDPQCTNAHFQLGVLSEESGTWEQAVAHYRRAVETDPACLMALTNLAILHSSRGDLEAAREMVQRALQLEPDADRRRALQRLIEPAGPRPSGTQRP